MMGRRQLGWGVAALALGLGCNGVDAASALNDEPPDSAGTLPAIPQPSGDDPEVQKGWSSLVARDCATCHQSPEASDGVLSGQTAVVPDSTAYGSNLTPDPDTGMDAWDATDIVAAMRDGVDNRGVPLCPAMPRYPTMTESEGNAIAAYLQSLVAVHHHIPSSSCPPIKPMPDAGEADGATPLGDGGLAGASDDSGGDAGTVDATIADATIADATIADATVTDSAAPGDDATSSDGSDDAGADDATGGDTPK